MDRSRWSADTTAGTIVLPACCAMVALSEVIVQPEQPAEIVLSMLVVISFRYPKSGMSTTSALPLPSEMAIHHLPTILPTTELSSPSLTGTVAEVLTGPVGCGMIGTPAA